MFLVIFAFALFLNILWYGISDYWLRRELVQYPKAKRYTRTALLLWIAIIFVPLLSSALGLGNPLEYGPWIWLSVTYLWIGAILLWMLALGALGIPIWGIDSILTYRKKHRQKTEVRRSGNSAISQSEKSEISQPENSVSQAGNPAGNQSEVCQETPVPGLTRRQLIKVGLVAVPPLLVGSTAISAAIAKNKLDVRYIDLPIRNLPEDLHGYTITQLSDMHIGMVTGKDRVERIVETANSLRSDLMVVTGDILDNNFDYMGDVVGAISELKADQGVFLCIGNHDRIVNGNEWVRTVRAEGFNLLLDEAALVDTGKTPIKLLGIDYSHSGSQDAQNIYKADMDQYTPEGSLKVLLAHHPHAFDAAVQADIPVTLAGHTHGGQLAVRIGEEFELFNAGNLIFRYVDGMYRKPDGHSLFVHRGSGDWFPLRTGVPTDVVQLRLVREEV